MAYVFSDKEFKRIKKNLKKIRNVNYRVEKLDYEEIIEMLHQSLVMKYLPEPDYENLKLLPPKEIGIYKIDAIDSVIDIPVELSPIIEFSTIYGGIIDKDKNIFMNKKLFKILKKLIEGFLKAANKGKSLYNVICKVLDDADEFYNELREMVKELEEEYDNEVLEVLLLLPDMFVYLCRLIKIEDFSDEYKLKLILAIIYIVSTLDVLPEAIIVGPVGYIDDAYWAIKVIKEGFTDEVINPELLKEIWPGRTETLEKVNFYYDLLKRVLGSELEDKINKFIWLNIKRFKQATDEV